MGAIIAKFRKQPTTTELLESIQENIDILEKYTYNTQAQKKRFVTNFLAVSIGTYVLTLIIFYFFYFPTNWGKRLLITLPMAAFPVVVMLLRRLLTWYFERKLNKNSKKLIALRSEKKKILEQVMEKETYKVAVSLLAKYSDKPNTNVISTPGAINKTLIHRTALGSGQNPNSPISSMTPIKVFNTNNSNTGNAATQLMSATNRPAAVNTQLGSTLSLPNVSGTTAATAATAAGSLSLTKATPRQLTNTALMVAEDQELRRRTPFPIINFNEKTLFERIVDVIIGDSASDHFAMICKECHGHNGMALKEDFEYACYRCVYCNTENPARKLRPVAPRLTMPNSQSTPTKSLTNRHSSESSSEHTNTTDDELMTKTKSKSRTATSRTTNSLLELNLNQTENSDDSLADYEDDCDTEGCNQSADIKTSTSMQKLQEHLRNMENYSNLESLHRLRERKPQLTPMTAPIITNTKTITTTATTATTATANNETIL